MIKTTDKDFKSEYEELLLSMPPLNQTEEELWNISKFILDK
jgi:hypothetical protein